MKDTKIIIINTVEEEAIVALVCSGEIMGEEKIMVDRKIGVKLLIKIQKILKDNDMKLSDIDAFAVHAGGDVPTKQYSSLRVGVLTGVILSKLFNKKLIRLTKNNINDMIEEVMESGVVETIIPKYTKK